METRNSSIGTSLLSPSQRIGVQQAFRNDQRETTTFSASQIALTGVPGEVDHHKFLTGPFQNMLPIHSGVNGGPVVSSLAVNTDKNQWRDHDTGRFQSLFVPAGEYGPPISVTFPRDPDTNLYVRTETPDYSHRVAVPPSRAVITNRTRAGAFSVNLVQDTDTY